MINTINTSPPHKYSIAQVPTITSQPERIANISQPPQGNLFNSSIDKSPNLHISYYPTSQQPIPSVSSLNTNKPHPLARYSSKGYYDPSFESVESDKLSYRGSISRAILASEHDRYKYPLLDFDINMEENDDMNGNGNEMKLTNSLDESKYMKIVDQHNLSNLFSPPEKEEIHKINHQPFGTISSSQVPLYPEIYPYISKSSPTEGWSANDKNRLPAGSALTSTSNSGINSVQEAFNLSFEKNVPTITLNSDETKEFEKLINPKSSVNGGNKHFRQKIHVDVKPSSQLPQPSWSQPSPYTYSPHYTYPSYLQPSLPKESFENPIEKEADYMYLQALKIRALAVCKFLNDHVSYKKWSSNWKLLDKNLKRNGFLFERLDDTDADIAYVINKGDQVKFRIRDEKRYVPLNIYQYVLYHEMAHMSTTELQHTPKFHELLNIISLAAFELGFIDLSRTSKEFYMTNGQPILCRASLKEEITDGCDWLRKANPHSDLYYNSIKKVVKGF